MDSLFTSALAHNHYSHPKPLPPTTTTTTFHNTSNTTPQFSYEPTSVLDVRRSPSPVTGALDSVSGFNYWEWGSLELGLDDEKDDSTHSFTIPPDFIPFYEPQIPIPNLPPYDPSPAAFLSNSDSYPNTEFDCQQLEQLIRAAALIESNELRMAEVLLARLNFHSPAGKPFQRSSFYFKEALQQLLLGSLTPSPPLSKFEILSKILAQKAYTDISPITMFTNFTVNQVILEELNGAAFIHIIDFEIGIGGQWASFMQSIVTTSRASPLTSLRITAVIPEDASIEASLITHNLQLFAHELKIQFKIEFVYYNSFEILSFTSMKFLAGEMIAVNLSPSILRRLRTSDSINGFFRFLRQISPKITMFVDGETRRDIRDTSFRKTIVNGIEFYSSLFESLDMADSNHGETVKRIETNIFRQKIAATVAAAAGNSILPWRELMIRAGMVPAQFSEFADCQAEWVVRRTQIRGFHVERRQGVLALCWKERELVAMSAWK